MPLTALTYEILLAIADRARHGYGILKEIERRGGSAPSTAALYLALQRMEGGGMIEAAPDERDEGEDPRRRYLRLTRYGRQLAEAESARLASLVAVARRKRLLASVLSEAAEGDVRR